MFNSFTPNVSLESILLYPQFYRQFGVRRAVQLVGPPLIPLQKLDLPRDSILHHISDDEASYGLAGDDPIMAANQRLIMVHHVTQLTDHKGTPRSTALQAGSMQREYHRKNRMTRAVTNYPAALRDPRTLVVENYALLPHLFRYTTSYFRGYYKWWNIHATMMDRVKALAEETEREQYLICKLPTVLPTLALLKKAEASLSRSALAAFSQDESMLILELWKWIGLQREESVFAKAGIKALDKLNIVFIESGRWSMLNLGELERWRKPDTKEVNAQAEPGSIAPEQLQKRFLRYLMFVFESRTVSVPAEQVISDKTEQAGDSALRLVVPGTGPEGRAQTLKLRENMSVDHLPEHPAEETEENILAIDEAITKDLSAFDELHVAPLEIELQDADEPPVARTSDMPVIDYVSDKRTLEDGVMDKVNLLTDQGLVSGAEYRRFQAISTNYQRLKDPYGSDRTLAEAMVVNPADLEISQEAQIPKLGGVFDASMLKSSLFEFDSKYLDKVMRADILQSVIGLQHAGIALTHYEIENIETALDTKERHSIQLTPVQGRPTTLHFDIPKIGSDGTFYSNGVRYRLRKQRGDMPIRKLSPSRVALTSYYSKLFVTRSEKQVHNYAGWLTNQIVAMSMDAENETVTSAMLSDVFESNLQTPRMYSIMAKRFRSFTVGSMDFFFDYHARLEHFAPYFDTTQLEKSNMLLVGRQGKQPLVIGKDNMIYQVDGDVLTELGTFEQILGLTGKSPLEMVEIRVFKKFVPLGMFLAHHMGLSNLISLLRVTPRRVMTGERLNLSDDEYALRFEDETLIFNRDNRLVSQILSGIASFEKSTRNYPVHLFDKKDIYLNVLEQAGIGVRYLREMDLMVDLFVDPITKEILAEQGNPTDFVGLLLKANELLTTDWSPDETDMRYMRIKGYERVAGAVYNELVKALRLQRARGTNRSKLEMPPYAVWQSVVQQDTSIKIVEETNPIHNLKELEEVTYSGSGGRSDRSMTARTRVFHPNDMGVISEATKDSSAVAITTFLTADPNLKNLRGVTDRYDAHKHGPTSLLSSSALLAPSADRDDPKRVNFISIQQSQVTFAKGYQISPLRTGYEQIIAHRTDDLFAYTAKDDGKVISVSAKSIVVEYTDGKTVSVELGRRYGVGSGATFPHSVVATMKEGDTFKKGDTVAYNEHYFSLDPLNPKQAVWKSGVLLKTAIMESTDTLEDSSAISQRAAELLETQLTKVRDIIVRFDHTLHNLVRPGDQVNVESILCTIEDAVTAQSNLFDENSIDTLRLIAANTPKAKFTGTVEKVEVFYFGELDDMSESLADIATESDRNRKRLARELKTSYTSGQVTDSMRVDGRNLPFKQAVIRIYITGPMSAGVGDKGVFANQMKTIFGRVMSGTNKTESGSDIDAIFGYQSISDRIVLSPEIMGTTITLLKVMSKRVADVWNRGKKP